MSKSSNEIPSEPTKFFSLFVPKEDWFQDLLNAKVLELLSQKQVEVAAFYEKKLTDQLNQGKELRAEDKKWLTERLKDPKRKMIDDNYDGHQHGSLSDYLLDLVIQDLCSKKLIPKTKASSYQEYVREKPKIKKTQFNADKVHSTFSLYLPKKKDQEWIREKLDSEFLREKRNVTSRSDYIWDLFLLRNRDMAYKFMSKRDKELASAFKVWADLQEGKKIDTEFKLIPRPRLKTKAATRSEDREGFKSWFKNWKVERKSKAA